MRRWWSRPGRLPLLPFAPAVVVLVGLGVAVLMGVLGLLQLRRSSDEAALERAGALAAVVAARVRAVPAEERTKSVEILARRTGADLALVNQQGQAVADTLGGAPSSSWLELLVARAGFTDAPTGRAAFAVSDLEPPLGHLALLVFVHAPAAPAGARRLAGAVGVLTAILLSVAAAVAYVLSRNAQDDVEYVQQRIEGMRRPGGAPGEPVPIRTFDQVGVVTAAFNELLERFAAAERTYRHDLRQVEALDRSRAQFLATLSHELRTPLNAILGFAEVLLSEVDGPLTPSAREDLEMVRSSGEHLRALIDDVLDLSAMETGRLRLERREVDVAAVAEQVLREAQPLVAGRAVALERTGDLTARAWADARRVRQILVNLVSNAVKFTAAGRVSVRVATEAGRVVVEVTDTGAGIPAPEAAVLFQEFRQVGDRVSRRKGSGLGLAIAKRLTTMHGGQITLASQPGHGSTFRVELPVSAEDTEPEPPARPSLAGVEGVE